MSDHFPILSPPPELAQKCWDELRNQAQLLDSATGWDKAIALAYQAGADRELEACLRYAGDNGLSITRMRAARRPERPTLKEEALEAWEIANQTWTTASDKKVATIILRAIEALPND